PTAQEAESGAILCPPAVYLFHQDDCLPLGAAQFLTEMAALGITFPIQPLPAYVPNPDLNTLPYSYFLVTEKGLPLFPSLEAAMANQPSGQVIQPGKLLYASYQERVENEQGVFYLLRSGVWIQGEGARAALPYPFQGLLFSSTPRNSFGWLIEESQSRIAPGFNSPYSGHKLYRFDKVQVYSTQVVGNVEWNLIGPDEWLEARLVARLDPRHSPPEGVTGKRWIDINLYEQTLGVYENNQLVYATLIASGVEPFWTRPGLFQIYQKLEETTMSGSFEADRSDYYYLEDVPWTMYFDQARALHGTYWHTLFGYPRSKGCVNLSIGDARWLFDWAVEGDWVYVYDPSGQTPTDPALFGAGAP
ncbi:MAG: L,D-transpeptidase, partial [Pseudomonadota bacterium]